MAWNVLEMLGLSKKVKEEPKKKKSPTIKKKKRRKALVANKFLASRVRSAPK